MTDSIGRIRELLPHEELLCQLAEEAAELGQAALKLRRVYDGTNPTPKGWKEAHSNLVEEISDVYLCLVALRTLEPETIVQITETAERKANRWLGRLEGRGVKEHGEK